MCDFGGLNVNSEGFFFEDFLGFPLLCIGLQEEVWIGGIWIFEAAAVCFWGEEWACCQNGDCLCLVVWDLLRVWDAGIRKTLSIISFATRSE